MKNTRTLVLAAAVVILAAIVLSDSFAEGPEAPAAPTGLAVCDIVRVFNNYKRAEDLNQEFNARQQEIENQSKKRLEAIEVLRLELEGLNPGSKEYQRRIEEAEKLQIEHKAWLEIEDVRLRRLHYRLTREMYGEILQMVSSISEQRNLSLVLCGESEELISNNLPELVREIERRKVLYRNDNLDITETVLTRLNETYAAGAR
jgi:Skp family chaperone for outer membrane proteins